MTANTRSDTRHENKVFTTPQRMYIPATTATNDQPHRANPAAAKATFKIHQMVIGRKENRCFDIFSVCFIISDLFFNRHAARSRRSDRVSGARQIHVQPTQGFPGTNTLARRERGRFFAGTCKARPCGGYPNMGIFSRLKSYHFRGVS